MTNQDARTYWDQVARTYNGYLSKQWDEHRGTYGDGGCNPWMLVIHSIRAGHLGLKEDRERARTLVDHVTRPGIWNRERSSWNVAPDLPEIGSHPSVESRYVEALYYAWKYRDAIGLSPRQVGTITDVLRAKAESAYSKEDWYNQENAYWYNNAICLAYEVTQDVKYAEYWKAYMSFFVDHVDTQAPGPSGGITYLFPDFTWHYSDHHPFELLEYGLMCYGGMINYQRMHDRGLYAFTREQLQRVHGYQQYALGMWRLDGYLNWDTGAGHERLMNAEYWAFSRKALIAMIYASSVNARPEDRHYARFLFDRGLELFARMDTWDGDPEDGAVPLQPYGAGSNFADKLSTNCLFIAELCMAIDLGVEKVEPKDPGSLWRYNWYHRKLSVSTHAYSATIVPLGMRRFDYGGLELTGLFDGEGRSLTIPRPSHFPRACSLEIPEEIPVRTHNVGLLATPSSLPKSSDGEPYFMVVESPDGDLSSLREYDARIFTPTFERLVAKGSFTTSNYRYDTKFVFEKERIGIIRELSLVGEARNGKVIATIPVAHHIVRVHFVGTSGRSQLVLDGDVTLPPVVGLETVAYLEFEGDRTGFIVVPSRMLLGARSGAWSRRIEGATIYVGKLCRTVFLCLAGFDATPKAGAAGGADAGEPVRHIVFDTWWIPTDGSRGDAARKWKDTARGKGPVA